MLKGKVALITGAASGIGRATAACMAREGAMVMISDIDAEHGEVAARELAADGSRVGFVKGDVRSIGDTQAMVEATVSALGSLDILVNNAGISRIAPFEELSEEDWDLCMDVNGKGTFLCSRAAVRIMKEKGGGAIVNLASINSFEGKVERGAFSYSKGGIVNLTRTMAAELGRYGIRVNAVAPGCVRTTEFMKHVEAGVVDLDTLTALTPLGMLQEPEDIAEAIIFLASEKARFISGVTLPVDGGWLSDGGKGMGRPSERT